MMAKKQPEWTAAGVMSVLGKTLWTEPAHKVLHEVRNATGYGVVTRSADALVVSLWPSRGVWFGGVEVKVSRSDWQSELKKPEKSAAIQRFCDYWWVATPAGIVREGELPETWGLVEVSGSKHTIIKQAPKLTPEPLTTAFVAAVLRNQAEAQERMRNNVRFELVQELGKPVEDDVKRLQETIQHLELQAKADRQRADELQKTIHEFESASGCTVKDWRRPHNGKAFALALELSNGALGLLANSLEGLAKSARAAEREALSRTMQVANDAELAEVGT
jgi:hypothetical protein